MDYGTLNETGANYSPTPDRMAMPTHGYHGDAQKNHQMMAGFTNPFYNYNFSPDAYGLNRSPLVNHSVSAKDIYRPPSFGHDNKENDSQFSEKDDEEPIDCADCNKEFPSLQHYMEHPCSKNSKKSDVSGKQRSSPEICSSDIETFNGKIVYNPDGSAYIIEDDSNNSETLHLPKQEGSIIDARGANSPSMKSFPQIASAYFVPRNTMENKDMYSASPYTNSQHPIMHSYRVFDLRGKNVTDRLPNMIPSHNSAEAAAKPILMCFICKLSFGNAKPFMLHSINEHKMDLLRGEKELLALKDVSAIIQGIGKSKDPLMSFLEMNLTKSQHSFSSGSSQQSSVESDVSIPRESSTNVSYIYAKPKFPHPPGDSSDSDSGEYPVTSSPIQRSLVSRLTSERSPDEGDILSPQSSKGLPTSVPDNMLGHSLALCKSLKMENGPLSSSHVFNPLAVSSVRDSINAAVVNALLSTKSSPSHDSPTVSTKTSASAFSSDVPRQTSPLFYGVCDEHPHGRSQDIECPKCDLVLSSSQSLGGHMTMMHSRNSCKTLKCPKCNWHYKYQETLEIHMKEKHPDSDAQCIYCLTSQPHPRLARGESYSCGYKPYRCEVCNYSTTTKGNLSIHMQSDKHINNVQEMSNGGDIAKMQHPPPTPSTPVPMPIENLQRQKPKPKPTWRCDVCNYETNVARNLRIHMTSEKHTHNMMVLQQNMKHMQHDMQLQMNQMMLLGQPEPAQFLGLQNQMPGSPFQFDQSMMMSGMPQNFPMPVDMRKENEMGGTSDPIPDASDSSKLFHCCVCNIFITDSIEALHQHLQHDRTRHQENETVTVANGTYLCNLCTYKTNLKANFQLHCKTDKHLQRLQLVNHIKEGGPGNEWRLKYLNASNPIQIRCNACDFYTNSIHKLQVHMTTPRHESSAQLFRHLQNCEAKLPGNKIYYQCALCEFSTKAKINLIHHVASVKHIQNESMYRMQLSQQGKMDIDLSDVFVAKELSDIDEVQFDDEDGDGENLETNSVDDTEAQDSKAETQAMPEITESPLVNNNNNNNIKEDAQVSENINNNVIGTNGSMIIGDTTETALTENNPDFQQCPHCSFSSDSQIRIQAHILTQHMQILPEIPCALCQEKFSEKSQLERHLIQVHNVREEGLSRLMHLVDERELADGQTAEINLEAMEAEATQLSMEEAIDTAQSNEKSESPDNQYRCQTCSVTFCNIDGLYAHQNELGHLELKQTPRGPGYLCWKKGCNQYFKTAQALQVHFREIHAKKQSNCVGDQSSYQHKCNQCTLAFRASDKLKLHLQYHLIQAATRCNICAKTCKSIPSLKNHIETCHNDSSELEKLEDCSVALNQTSIADAKNSAIVAMEVSQEPDINANNLTYMKSEPSNDDDSTQNSVLSEKFQDDADAKSDFDPTYKDQQFMEDYINSQAMAEGSYDDPIRKYKCHRCKVAFTKQNYLTGHNKTLQHRKGDKLSYPMEKFLDPNRPYKCDICMESFTQKNILLVHYNSVSHLHKVKLQSDSPTPTTAEDLTPATSTVTTTATVTTSSTTAQMTVSASSASSTVTTNASDAEKRLYKCNICKVSYSQLSTLDIHMRSVAHQTRASKLQELVLSGQVDITQPLIEQPESGNCKMQQQQKQMLSDFMHNMSPAMALGNPLSQPMFFPGIPTSFGGFPTMPHIPIMPTMDPTIQLLLAQSVADNLITTSALSAVVPSAALDVKIKREQNDSKYRANETDSDKMKVRESSGDVDMSHFKMNFSRAKLPLHKHLLENIGFECVMQFNEYTQSCRRRERDQESNDDNVDQRSDETMDTAKTEIDIPEIDKHPCKSCNLIFSSVWVLKAHEEELHKVSVPLNVIEDFGEKFKSDFDKKQPQNNEPATPNVSEKDQPQRCPSADSVSDKSQDGPVVSVASVIPSLPTSQHPSAFEMSQLFPMYGMMPMPMPFMPNSTMTPSFMPMMSPGIDSSVGLVSPNPFIDPSIMAAQRQAQQSAANQKRARTRISDDQLKILRAYFDINNSPTEEQVICMSDQSGLPAKVIKHWFRNTLFKERQRNKDSPYNFSNAPTTTLDLEEYERTGKIPVSESSPDSEKSGEIISREPVCEKPQPPMDIIKQEEKEDNDSQDLVIDYQSDNSMSMPATPTTPSTSLSTATTPTHDGFNLAEHLAHASSSGKRANRTRFSDFQIRSLQEYFDRNAYPKDTELERLSSTLSLNPRVITVWFQNQRQKARKVYENQAPASDNNNSSSSDGDKERQLTSPHNNKAMSLSYHCKKCSAVFQRYYELIKHQRQASHFSPEDLGFGNSDDIAEEPSMNHDRMKEDFKLKESIKKELIPEKTPELNLSKKPKMQCDKCNLDFTSLEQYQEHQNIHILHPSIFPSFSMNSALGMLQSAASQQQMHQQLQMQKQLDFGHPSNLSPLKRPSDEDDRDDQPRDKRLRTTILPEQLDYLYQKYQIDCNPSRKQLEAIAAEVQLKKRVVQVWFQNTRARERKGQYRAHQQLIHKRCPFCKALFRAKSALESHLATKHPEEMARGEISVDSIPDAAMESPGSSTPIPGKPLQAMAPNVNDLSKLFSPPAPMQQLFPMMPQSSMSLPTMMADPIQMTMKQFYEDSYKKFFNELSGTPNHPKKPPPPQTPPSAPLPAPFRQYDNDDAPLDLSKPIKVSTEDKSSSDGPSTDLSEHSIDESRRFSFDSMDMNDNSNTPPSPTGFSNHMNQMKRHRTQMTNSQVKLMKLLFQDYKTPTMAECEMLGNQIGLAKRVVQVWFQNARAKEKKVKTPERGGSYNSMDFPKPPELCKICNFKYSHKYTVQDHIFTKKHLDNLKSLLRMHCDPEKETPNPLARQQQEYDAIKSSWENSNHSGFNSSQVNAMAMGGFGGLGKSYSAKNERSKENDRLEKKPGDIKLEEGRKPGEEFLNHQMLNPFGSFMPPGMDPSMLPLMYPNIPGYVPPAGLGMPMMQPGIMPGAEQMMAFDPLTFGTPLVMLQIPQQSIKDVTLKLSEETSTVAQYTQDCKSMNDLKSMVSSLDYACAGESMVDVGFICKKCHMVYPAKEACVNHQQTLCFPGGKLPENIQTMLKLEQIQYDCRACSEKCSTLNEYKQHCQAEVHKSKAGKLRQKVSSPASDSALKIARHSLGVPNGTKLDYSNLSTSLNAKSIRIGENSVEET